MIGAIEVKEVAIELGTYWEVEDRKKEAWAVLMEAVSAVAPEVCNVADVKKSCLILKLS